MLITKKANWNFLKNPSNTINIDDSLIDSLRENDFIDCRKLGAVIDKTITDDFKEVCKQSLIPIPSHQNPLDDISSESYYPVSDWQGPTGENWIGKN